MRPSSGGGGDGWAVILNLLGQFCFHMIGKFEVYRDILSAVLCVVGIVYAGSLYS